jgi:chromosome segregation ATPase
MPKASDSAEAASCDAKLKADLAKIKVLQQQIHDKEAHLRRHESWIEQAEQAVQKLQDQIMETNDTTTALQQTITTLSEDKLKLRKAIRQDQLERNLKAAKSSLDSLLEQSKQIAATKESLLSHKSVVQQSVDTLQSSIVAKGPPANLASVIEGLAK